MVLKLEKGKKEILQQLVARIKQSRGHSEELCAEFALQYFSTVALEDLKIWKIEDLHAACMHFWGMMLYRKHHEIKVRVYNPTFAADGWHSSYTIIEILVDEMPFLVDSIRVVIDRMKLYHNLIINMGGIAISRNDKHELTHIYPITSHNAEGVILEEPILIQINKITDKLVVQELEHQLKLMLDEIRAVVADWPTMRQRVQESIVEVGKLGHAIKNDILSETQAFLNWIDDHHFTFLGMIDYQIKKIKNEQALVPVPGSDLGILRDKILAARKETVSDIMSPSCGLMDSAELLLMTKTNKLSTIHRDAYTDYIGIKHINSAGEVIGERRIIGLYTSAAYNTNPNHIPFLRHKVAQVMRNSDLSIRSHKAKVLLNIVETLPRDDLIQMSENELLDMAMGIFSIQERRQIRLFAREDIYKRFVSCLVYIPREQFNSSLRETMQNVLGHAFDSAKITHTTWFSESVLARVNFVVRLTPEQANKTWDFKAIERELIEVGRSWIDYFQKELYEVFNEEKANLLFEKYKQVFSNGYKDNFEPHVAVRDMMYVESLQASQDLLMHFYCDREEKESFRLKIYQHDKTIPLAEILPILENLGMKAISERPYRLRLEEGQVWITDFSLYYVREVDFSLEEMQSRFQTAFVKVWHKEVENDSFNQLILAAGLDWCQVKIFRAYARYFKQIGFTFSQDYIAATLVKYAEIAKDCIALFETRFNPSLYDNRQERELYIEKLSNLIIKKLNDVSNLDEDKIIRQYVNVINCTLRTNYYQMDEGNECKNYLSLKFNCRSIIGMPKPCPLYEIFVYSPRVEGVHLRGGKVARGGLRWSDRREDFRTEVLGLMKAQQVKNSIIVPTGAKGGFIPKNLVAESSRDAAFQEAVICYRMFIKGLLDLTDNYVHGRIVRPKKVVFYDEADPYLVVAADKGTATFSDYANEIAKEYNFWLGDAFASGGSVGYDHKKMGITAKGAWESVKRHFYEKGEILDTKAFTVVGIGDMSGDVFGNGLLLSKEIQLVGAFNHIHIFVDPNPNPHVSFKERERLFALARSSWIDYDPTVLSKGGGVFERSAKSIPVSKEMKARFGIKKQTVEPNELIAIMLVAKIDLLWSAGIGTFVKSSQETHADVGDRTNDAIRVNASDLKCRIIGEGGNLGLTQKARVEYDFQGGLVYTDFIDNSAGVSCSDKEVNIKILLNTDVMDGKLSYEERNSLLVSMTDDVAALVLKDNKSQPKAINLAAFQASSIDLHIRYIHYLERSSKLDREIENIPDDKALLERKSLGKCLGMPSLSVLHSYSKMILKECLLASDLPEDSFLDKVLLEAFPHKLQSKYAVQIQKHPLRREIIATKLCNIIADEMGFSFVYRVKDETAASEASIVRAYLIARSVLGLDYILSQIAEFQDVITAEHEKIMLMIYVRLVRRMVRWLLRNSTNLHIQENVDRYKDGFETMRQILPDVLSSSALQKQMELLKTYKSWGVSAELAYELALTRSLFSAFDLIEASFVLGKSIKHTAVIYYKIGERLEIDWLRTQVIMHTTETRWDGLSREAIRDDLDKTQRSITEVLIKNHYHIKSKEIDIIDAWLGTRQASLSRWQEVVANFKASTTLNYTMFFVAIRQLMDLTEQAPLLAEIN